MAYGLTIDGFVPMTTEVIRDDINTAVKALPGAGPTLDVSDSSAMGQLIGIVADRLGSLWELAEAVNSSQDPDQATGVALEEVCLITGTVREAAAASTAILSCTGTPLTNIPQGSIASTVANNAGGAIDFATFAAVIIAAMPAWTLSTVYTAGQRVTNNTRVYLCTIGGTSAPGGGPHDNVVAELDNTVTWRYLGEGTGAVNVFATCPVTGPNVAASGAINVIKTPIGGWSNVSNVADANPGIEIESDAELKVKRQLELAQGGEGTADDILAAAEKIIGVSSAMVLTNVTDSTDANGLPPHSVELIVTGGDDQTLYDMLLKTVGAGIATYGLNPGSANDAEGVAHVVSFTRPVPKPIYVAISVIKDAVLYAGDAVVKAALALYPFALGGDVRATALGSKAFIVQGVYDVPRSGALGGTLISFSPSPTSDATLVIALREIATLIVANISVTSTNGTP